MKILSLLLLLIGLSKPAFAEVELTIARINLDDATRLILKQGNKRVLAATTKMINGREIHIIKVLTPDGHIQHYKIDAENGKIIG